MEYLQDYGDFNPRTKLDAIEYVNNNYYALKQIMNLDNKMDEDELKEILIKYFSRFPDQISSISLQLFGHSINYTPTLNNIGGVIKYR